jgi:hypothetical protein
MTWQTLTGPDLARIGSHSTVMYALSKHFAPADAVETARAIVSLGRWLLDAGGFAIKCESSGIAHPPTFWLAFDDRTRVGSSGERWDALYRAYVLGPIGSQDFYTCGTHLLGSPDLIVAESLLRAITAGDSNTASTASRLFARFAVYLLDECPPGAFGSGHTFSEARDTPRFRLVWEPCTGYAADDFYFNTFGRRRFTEP